MYTDGSSRRFALGLDDDEGVGEGGAGLLEMSWRVHRSRITLGFVLVAEEVEVDAEGDVEGIGGGGRETLVR